MTWMTPFDAAMSAFTTFASSTVTPPPLAAMSMVSPLTALAERIFATSAEETRPATTW